MSITPKFEIKPFIDLALRRKWWIVISFILALLGGVGYLAVAPKIYRASTLILLEPQSIPDSFVRSTVTESMEARLRTITQQIHSRTNLERIIEEFQLGQAPPQTPASKILQGIEDRLPFLRKFDPSQQADTADDRSQKMMLVAQLRGSLDVAMRGPGGGGGRDQSLAFEISMEWYDPEPMPVIVNAIASRFIEENLNAREERAVGTTDFFEQEIAAIKDELEAREKENEAFQKENMGMLPDQLTSNINILNQLREEATNLERRLDQEKQEAMLLKSQAQTAAIERESLLNSIRQERPRAGGSHQEPQMTTEQLTSGGLQHLESELQRLRSQYTDKHPDIKALERRIDAIRKEGGGTQIDTDNIHPGSSQNPLTLQLFQINARIDSYQREIKEIEKQIEVYKDRVERTPSVEMEMSKLLRDYQTVRQRYDSLLQRKMDAKMAEQLEKKKKGEQFRVLDSAVKPGKPFKPNAIKVMFMALVLGLGIGCGLAYVREALDPCFYSPEELEAFLDAKVIVCLPTADDKIPS